MYGKLEVQHAPEQDDTRLPDFDGSLRKSDAFPPRVKSVTVVQLGNSYGIAPLRDNVSLDSRLVAETAA